MFKKISKDQINEIARRQPDIIESRFIQPDQAIYSVNDNQVLLHFALMELVRDKEVTMAELYRLEWIVIA